MKLQWLKIRYLHREHRKMKSKSISHPSTWHWSRKTANNATSSRRLVASTPRESRDADSEIFRTGIICQNGGRNTILFHQWICYGWTQLYAFWRQNTSSHAHFSPSCYCSALGSTLHTRMRACGSSQTRDMIGTCCIPAWSTLDSYLLGKISHHVEPIMRSSNQHVSSAAFITQPNTNSIVSLEIHQETANWDWSKTPILQEATKTPGGVLWKFGSHTFVPMSWACNKQTAVSHSSTEASIILLDARLRVEGVPDLSAKMINMLYTQAGGGSKLVHQTQILKHLEPFGDIDDVLPNARLFSMRTSYYIFEDNEAVIKQIIRGRSPTMCHASCW